MEINQAGLDLLKSFEKCRLAVYADQAGHPTAGYGHRCDDLPLGSRVTPTQVEEWLIGDLERFEKVVEGGTKVALTPNQFSALVCFAYNVGGGAFLGSKLLRYLNAGDMAAAVAQWPRWNRAGGQVSLGLTRRRAAEQALFLTS